MSIRVSAALCIMLISACSRSAVDGVSTMAKGRPAESLPGRFDPSASFKRIAPEDTLPGPGCLSPLHDPRDDTRLIIRRSDNGVGDYEVATGKYGVQAGELLRLECNTGEALGIVRR